MNPKQFLVLGGAILLLVGILGFVGIIGPTPAQSLFHDFWWFDNSENIAHTFLGVVALAATFVLPASYQKLLVLVVGIFALLVAAYGWVISPLLLGAMLQNPPDDILHLVIGIWGIYASMVGGKSVAKPETATA